MAARPGVLPTSGPRRRRGGDRHVPDRLAGAAQDIRGPTAEGVCRCGTASALSLWAPSPLIRSSGGRRGPSTSRLAQGGRRPGGPLSMSATQRPVSLPEERCEERADQSAALAAHVADGRLLVAGQHRIERPGQRAERDRQDRGQGLVQPRVGGPAGEADAQAADAEVTLQHQTRQTPRPGTGELVRGLGEEGSRRRARALPCRNKGPGGPA